MATGTLVCDREWNDHLSPTCLYPSTFWMLHFLISFGAQVNLRGWGQAPAVPRCPEPWDALGRVWGHLWLSVWGLGVPVIGDGARPGMQSLGLRTGDPTSDDDTQISGSEPACPWYTPRRTGKGAWGSLEPACPQHAPGRAREGAWGPLEPSVPALP